MTTFYTRALSTGALTAVGLVAAAGIASAHVSVHSPGSTQGGYGVLEFRVPTESDTASTTALTVQLPELTSARTQPLPGWTAVVERDADERATSVTWTADPGNPGVGPGQFQQFLLSAGPLPDEDSVSFPSTQSYSDGEIVNWDQPISPDGTEPDYPAPTIALASAGDDHDGHGGHGGTGAATTLAASSTDVASASDSTARWLGGAGLVLGALGAALGIGATVRSRRS